MPLRSCRLARLTFFAALLAGAASAQPARLAGTVIEAATARPLADVNVAVVGTALGAVRVPVVPVLVAVVDVRLRPERPQHVAGALLLAHEVRRSGRRR